MFFTIFHQTAICLLRFYPTLKCQAMMGMQEQGAPKALCWLAKSLKGIHNYEKSKGYIFIQMWG